MQETLEDVDLQPVMNSHPTCKLCKLFCQQKEKPKKTIGWICAKKQDSRGVQGLASLPFISE